MNQDPGRNNNLKLFNFSLSCSSEAQQRKQAEVSAAAAVSFSAEAVVFQFQFFIFQTPGKVQARIPEGSLVTTGLRTFLGLRGTEHHPCSPTEGLWASLSCRENELLSSFYDFMGKQRHRGSKQTSVAEPSRSLFSFQLQPRALNWQKYPPAPWLQNCQ